MAGDAQERETSGHCQQHDRENCAFCGVTAPPDYSGHENLFGEASSKRPRKRRAPVPDTARGSAPRCAGCGKRSAERTFVAGLYHDVCERCRRKGVVAQRLPRD